MNKVKLGEGYETLRVQKALSFCPDIYPCAECGYPVVSGYCCTECGNEYPNKSFEEQEEE